MASDPNTAVFTAIGGNPAQVVPFKTHSTGENPASPPTLNVKRTKPGKERGVWMEHGKWVASAGFDPDTKKRIRSPVFDTQAEAVEWRASEISKKASDKVARREKARRLAQHESVDAADALDLLANNGFTGPGILRRVAEYFISLHPEVKATTVKEFAAIWLKKKSEQERRKRTIQSAKSTIAPFIARFGHVPLVEIRLEQIEEFVFAPAKVSATTRRNRGVVVTNFFNVAQKRGLIGKDPGDHPCFGLELPSKPEGNPDPWSLAEFETLLRFAWETEDRYHCTAYVACGGLAGIRTEELLKLRFCPEEIDIDRGLITVPENKAKKRRSRTFDMEPSLQRLLIALRARPRVRRKHVRDLPRPTDPEAKVVSPKLLWQFKEALKRPVADGGAGMPVLDEGGQVHRSKKGVVTITKPSAWRDNGLRASFATYHFERSPDRDPKLTVGIMGHTGSVDVFFNHYRRLAKPGDGAKFFGIPDRIVACPCN